MPQHRGMLASIMNEARELAADLDGKHAAPSKRRQVRTIVKQQRAIVWRDTTTVFNRAAKCLYPWSRRDYPGLRKSVLGALGRPMTWGGVQHWLSGRVKFPVWAAEAMHAKLLEDVAEKMSVIEDLARYLETRRHEAPRHLSHGLRKKIDE